MYEKEAVRVVQVRGGKETEVAKKRVPNSAKLLLRMQVKSGKEIRFSYSNKGKLFTPLTMNAIDAAYLPPWDRAVRAGIVARGAKGTTGVSDRFEMINQ